MIQAKKEKIVEVDKGPDDYKNDLVKSIYAYQDKMAKLIECSDQIEEENS